MTVAAESFYVSGGFWVAVAGVVVAVVAVVVTWRVAYPKRRLVYGMPVVTRLLNVATGGVRPVLEVRHGDRVLSDPYVLEVTLINEGRRDIPSDAFDRARPLVLDLGVPIVELLEITTSPGHAVPVVEQYETGLRIGPDLIARRQKLAFSLLVDEPPGKLKCPPPHPIDIDVRSYEPLRSSTVEQATAVVSSMLPGGRVLGAAMAWAVTALINRRRGGR